MRVVRGMDYDAVFDKVIYRATIRVYLKSEDGTVKDISLLRVRSNTPQGLEIRILRVKNRFKTLMKKNPKFFERIGKGETISLDEDE